MITQLGKPRAKPTGIDASPTACRVMAKRLRDVCKLREDENYWRHGKGFVVRDLPWTEAQLHKLPHDEFENWAVIALGGIPNKIKVGDLGIDGRIYPVRSMPVEQHKLNRELDFMDVWYPVQVKKMDRVGRPDIDKFEAAMIRANRTRGFFVAFDYSQDSIAEASRFFAAQHREITLLTVRDILDEQIARKLV